MSSPTERLMGNGSLIAQRLPLFWLTLRQFRAGWSLSVVGFFAGISAILSAIYLAGIRESAGSEFLPGVFLQLLVPTAIPLATLILATSALGNEIGDGTLPYCLLKPVWRLRIVLEKYLGVVTVAGLAFAVGLTLTWEMLALGGESMGWHLLGSLLLATVAGVLAYGALFLLVSLVIPRALLVGII